MSALEPKIPYSSRLSTKPTSNSSSPSHFNISSSNSPASSSKWAKFQEKFHAYSSHKSSTPSSSSNNINHSSGHTPAPIVPHINTSFSSVDSSFECPHDYLKNLSLDESSISPILNSERSYTPISSAGPTPPSSMTFPSRTTSLPKTNDSLITGTPPSVSHHQNHDFTTPPKVKPFMYSRSSSTTTTPRSKKTLINEKCCFCEELLSSKFSTGEKLIELTCGDTCHEECLWLLINDNTMDVDSKSTSDPNKIFPMCGSCGKLAVPTDEQTTDSIISKILLSTPPKLHPLQNSTSSDSLIISSNFQSQILSPRCMPTPSDLTTNSQKYQSLSLSNRNQKDLSIQIPTSAKSFRNSHHNIHHHHHHSSRHKSSSRGSSISAMSSIISSVSRDPSPTETTHTDTIMSLNNGPLNKIPVAMLRSEYIIHLIQNLQSNYPKQLKEQEIDSFGLLRLVDTLLISNNGENFTNYNVYLFQYNLLLVDQDYSNIQIYKLLKTPKISTPTSTILKVFLNNGSDFLYLSQKSNKILQKWIAGLCDYEFIFNSDNLSSTIKLSESSSKDSWTPVAPSSTSEDAASDQMTIPVLLSPINFVQDQTPVSTPLTQTSFKKTDDLIVIIDHNDKNLSSQVKITLQNIMKALSFKFKSLILICSFDEFQQAYAHGGADDILNKIGTIQDTSKSVNQYIQEIISTNNESDYGLLVISNNLTKSSLNSLILSNQLIVQIQSYSSEKFQTRENLIKLDSWDKIMEMLVMKYEISFDDSDSDADSNYENDSIDSDFDSDADFDNSDLDSIDSDKHSRRGYKETFGSGDKEDVNNEDEEELPSLNSNDEVNSSVQSDSPISSDDNNNNDNHSSTFSSEIMSKTNNNSRWSTLFKDIDDALLETTATLSEGND